MPFPDAQYPYDQRLAKHAELLRDTLEDAKAELIHLQADRLREAERCLYDAHQRLLDAWYTLQPTDPHYDGINRTRDAVDLLRRMTTLARKQAAAEGRSE